MGFMDKAKKLAEQAQQKLEETQTQFNQSQSAGGTGHAGAPPTQYDQHGRPVASDAPAAPDPAPAAPERPHGDPHAPAIPTDPARGPADPGGDPEPPHGDPLAPAVPDQTAPGPPPADAPPARPGGQGAPEDRNTVDYSPPRMTSGDPLAG